MGDLGGPPKSVGTARTFPELTTGRPAALMSALGQQRTSPAYLAMSALPLKADMRRPDCASPPSAKCGKSASPLQSFQSPAMSDLGH